jgi:hypothetical protein
MIGNLSAGSCEFCRAFQEICCHPMQSNPATGSAGICTTSSTPKACVNVNEKVIDGWPVRTKPQAPRPLLHGAPSSS